MAEKQLLGNNSGEIEEGQMVVSEALVDALVERLEAGVMQKLKKKISGSNAALGERKLGMG